MVKTQAEVSEERKKQLTPEFIPENSYVYDISIEESWIWRTDKIKDVVKVIKISYSEKVD